ncbi:MAG: single-stranded DNA-binding protein [Oscillospiraceae bacterium]|jgi:single-strand DNA-binding protein|nr:single-stranded DNA-binding protein [Oscillospiraceae bacterium]
MLNRIVLMGRLTREPELRTTQSGVSVVSFTLAVERDFATRGEEKQTDFLDIVAWRSTADFVSKYFRKGQLVAAEGRLQSRKWEDKEGNKRTAYEVVADNVYFAERKQEGYGAPIPDAPPPQRLPRQETAAPPFQLDTPATFAELDDDDDGELPF